MTTILWLQREALLFYILNPDGYYILCKQDEITVNVNRLVQEDKVNKNGSLQGLMKFDLNNDQCNLFRSTQVPLCTMIYCKSGIIIIILSDHVTSHFRRQTYTFNILFFFTLTAMNYGDMINIQYWNFIYYVHVCSYK